MTAKVRSQNLSREVIIEQAIALLEEEGLERLTMRELATRLGIVAGTLYLYFQDRDDLLDAMRETLIDRLDAGLEVEVGVDDWRTAAAMLMREIRMRLREHPNVIPLLQTSRRVIPAMRREYNLWVSILRAAGFEGEELVLQIRILIWITYGFIAMEQRLGSGGAPFHHSITSANGAGADRVEPAPEALASYGPESQDVLPSLQSFDGDQLFEAIIRTTLAGITSPEVPNDRSTSRRRSPAANGPAPKTPKRR